MSREVCGICWCPYDEDTGECACAPQGPTPPPEAQTEAEKIAYCAGWWDALAKARKAEQTVPSDCTDSHQPVAWYHVPHPGDGISPMVSLSQQREPSMYGAVVPLYLKEECYGEATNSEPFTVFTTLRQREWPALWTGCPNCASLEEQNTELDKKLADLEQTSLELCETCGWRTLIPGDVCLNCTRSDPDELTVAYMMGAQARMRKLTDEVIAELWYKNGTHHHHFARAIERWIRGTDKD